MLALIKDLFAHQAWADSALLNAVRQSENAVVDPEIRTLAHHIVMVQQFFLLQSRGLPFSRETASIVPHTLEEVVTMFRQTQQDHGPWLASMTEDDLSRTFAIAAFQNREITVGEALTQACLHSQGHRAQLAMLLRKMGGAPPVLDYILWTRSRPAAVWE